MRLIAQRSLNSCVEVDSKIIGSIEKGMVLLVGVGQEDTIEDVEYLVHKISNLRIFEDEDGKTNLSIKDVEGGFLSISQFTLMANTKKGHRPSFVRAAQPDMALELYRMFNEKLSNLGFKVETGQFGADMKLTIQNDGPMTIFLDSKHKDI